jgi:hypothetical protein
MGSIFSRPSSRVRDAHQNALILVDKKTEKTGATNHLTTFEHRIFENLDTLRACFSFLEVENLQAVACAGFIKVPDDIWRDLAVRRWPYIAKAFARCLPHLSS